ncbi:MAG: PaaI family thioesterase [Paraburkholderia sp.]|uniref:PaaI family thioesterase n=1 Tax=Paraburkholderia sp. TaxID=1926495 RepID=UPI003C4B3494
MATCQSIYVDAQQRIVAARIESLHLNPLGIAHGGFLATLADTAFGFVLRAAGERDYPPVTASLTMDYLAPARNGAWVEARVDIHKVGRRLINASCMLNCGDELIARASGVFVPV